MKVLVTGGAGYVGSMVAAELLKMGHEVVVYDSLVHGHRAAIPEGCRFVQGDVLDGKALGELLAEGGFEAAVHFAAFIEAGESMRDPGRFYRNNVGGSLSLVEALVDHSVSRVVFSSSAAVYASKDEPLAEGDTVSPASAYGETKATVERMLGWYQRVHGLRYAALRYFNAAGADPGGERGEDHRPETHLIPNVLSVALGRKDVFTLFGDDYPTPDGTCIRDYIHVSDLASAHVLALQALDRREALICNVGNGIGHSNAEVIEAAREVTGHPIPAEVAPRRAGDAPVLVAETSLIRRELGWESEYPELSTIVAHAWEWHRGHPHGYET
jgi:UDP-glucose 4-epimerase